MSTVIAETQLDYFEHDDVSPAFVRFFAPQPDGNDWRCSYQLEWDGGVADSYAMGVDSLQALTLALKSAAMRVGTSDDFKAGRIGHFGRRLTSFAELNDAVGLGPLKGFEQ